MAKYDHKTIEEKWNKVWNEQKINTVDTKNASKPFFNLMMFPYPSAEGMHVGNMYAFTASDVYGRFKRMQGFDVFEPIGLDGFGIHSENYALKIGRHPKEHARITEENFYRQLHMVGNMYDWSKTVETYNPNYYKWTQWIFIQLFKKGLAYRAKSEVNWCSKCKTVLSDEQVLGDKCERCNTVVIKKSLEQWFFKITDYAERLLKNLDWIDWTSKIKTIQKNWIGKKTGYKIKFDDLEVFTTRPDTLHGATFLAIAGHEDKFTGKKVTNPATRVKIPVWEAEYIVADYGTGVVMGVPAHDERDMVFAKKHGLEIVDMQPDEAMKKYAVEYVTYHLRDWLISRQRYWGPPIPMINCPKCGWQPVPEDQLPVLLPDIEDYQPKGEGKGPLAGHPEFYKTTCPVCGGSAERETDVSDTFLDSAWYFLRYPSAGIDGKPWDKDLTNKWLPVAMYTGGAEHATLHLMYTRFITMALKDMSYLDFEEPFQKFFAHGMIIKDGAKMSKSKGNVVNPDDYITKFGADTFRLYLMFLGPVSAGGDFRDSGIEGMNRWVNRIVKHIDLQLGKTSNNDQLVSRGLHKFIKRATEGLESRKNNLLIAGAMEFLNLVESQKAILDSSQWTIFIKLVAPLAPYLAQELWNRLGNTGLVHSQLWPEYDPKMIIDEKVTVVVQINGKVREKFEIESDNAGDEAFIQHLALESAKVQNYLKGASYRTIFVPCKLINFIVNTK
ncbi:leucine--tRNA ligase [Candidatus Amesbacteria bacterium]|nr:leucine--tRNA ligase [Candidatus Amesbacteria bacterium]